VKFRLRMLDRKAYSYSLPAMAKGGSNPMIWVGLALVIAFSITVGLIMLFAQGKTWASIPDPGVYDLRASPRSLLSNSDLADLPETRSFDLTLDGQRFGNVTLADLDVGVASGVTNVFEISGTGDTLVETMTVDGLRCGKLTVSDSTVHDLIYEDNRADGNSFALTVGTPSNVTVASARGQTNLTATNETYDKIILRGGTNGAVIKTLTITDVRTFGGNCVFSDLNVGTLTLKNMVIGTGDGIATADFLFSSLTVKNSTGDNNIEIETIVR
jgi:hypothetical protein